MLQSPTATTTKKPKIVNCIERTTNNNTNSKMLSMIGRNRTPKRIHFHETHKMLLEYFKFAYYAFIEFCNWKTKMNIKHRRQSLIEKLQRKLWVLRANGNQRFLGLSDWMRTRAIRLAAVVYPNAHPVDRIISRIVMSVFGAAPNQICLRIPMPHMYVVCIMCVNFAVESEAGIDRVYGRCRRCGSSSQSFVMKIRKFTWWWRQRDRMPHFCWWHDRQIII